MANWIEMKNETTNSSPIYVTVRDDGFLFSAKFTRNASLADKPYVNIMVDEESKRVAFKFNKVNSPGAYKTAKVKLDSIDTRTIENQKVIKAWSFLFDLKAKPIESRRFEPVYDTDIDAWVITIPLTKF